MSWCQVASFFTFRRTFAPGLLLVFATLAAQARPVAIDPAQSKVTVRVYKSGLFSALAHDHVIEAPIASGTIDAETRSVQLSFKVADMKVLDPGASASERQEIEATMKGPKVLDGQRFPVITFASTAASSAGAEHMQVTGTLTLHGGSKQVPVSVGLRDGKYAGTVTLKQTEWGITPVKIGGGAVKVKDEVVVEFSVVAGK